MSVRVENIFLDAVRIKREAYASGRVKYIGINRSVAATTASENWAITKYADDNLSTDQQTLVGVAWDDRGSLTWAF